MLLRTWLNSKTRGLLLAVTALLWTIQVFLCKNYIFLLGLKPLEYFIRVHYHGFIRCTISRAGRAALGHTRCVDFDPSVA